MRSQLVDEECLEGVRSARPDALETVFRTHAAELLRWVRSQGVDMAHAEEIVEETFLELVRDCRCITGDTRALRGWLYQATRRNLLDHHRSRQRDRTVPSAVVPDGPTDERLLEDIATDAVLTDQVDRALQTLSPDQREVVSLRYLADLSTAEVAAVTGRSRVATRQLLHTGRKALARRLDPARLMDHAGEAS